MISDEECQKNSDESLVGLVLTDADYFACLVNRYSKALKRYVIRLGSNDADADDILQEVFLNAYLHLNDFDKDLKFSSWIYRIAHNQAISAFRKANAKPTIELSDLEPWQEMMQENCPSLKFDQALLKEKTKLILEKIDPKYRDVLILKYFEEKDYLEMSDILKKPMGTIATLINRAKKQFARMAELELLK